MQVNLFFNLLKKEDVERLTAGWTFRTMLDYELGLIAAGRESPWHDLVETGFHSDYYPALNDYIPVLSRSIYLDSHRGMPDIYTAQVDYELSLIVPLFE